MSSMLIESYGKVTTPSDSGCRRTPKHTVSFDSDDRLRADAEVNGCRAPEAEDSQLVGLFFQATCRGRDDL